MLYNRVIDIQNELKKKSLLLLGPRQTGKSTLIRAAFPDAAYENLSDARTFRELSSRPELIRQRLRSDSNILIIDEAQKIPELFDEVQILLDENPQQRVVLTGSSARKLKRTGINLLPGRIWKRELFPLVYAEFKEARIQERVIKGSLPGIIDSEQYREELLNYVALYLDEEVRAEGLVRGIGDFGRFLPIAALYNAEQVNFTNISNDTGIKLNTVRAYFQILEDTLVGYQLPAFRKTKSRKAAATPKFYFFDCGVVNALLNQFEISSQGELFGKALEHIIFQELRAYLSYSKSSEELAYWRSLSKIEVDFLIGTSIGIEVKAKERVTSHDEKGLMALSEDIRLKRKLIICRESKPRKTDTGVEVLPFEHFLESLWAGEYC